MTPLPDIVYVDNDPESFIQIVPKCQQDRIEGFTYTNDDPAEEALEPAKAAKVWLFDFFLVEPVHAQSKDENGLSLFQKWRAAVGGARPTTVLISSALESAVGEPLGPVERHHVIAEGRGVEWIGDKSAETWRRLKELAEGVARISGGLQLICEDGKTSGTYNLKQLCSDVLGVPADAEWANSAQRQVDRARPPREVPIATSAATARTILGWLISHVLPYPSFLLTDAQAALRLQITPDSFPALAEAIEGHVHLGIYQARLAVCRYKGPLPNFFARRWWRAGIDDLVWHLSESSEGFSVGLKSLLGDLSVTRLEGIDEPVLLSDADLVETGEVAEARNCVRVTDEDFPAGIDPAWVTIEAAREDRKLAAMVVFEDRELLSADE